MDIRNDFEKSLAAMKTEGLEGFVRNSPTGIHLYALLDDSLVFLGGNRAADKILGIDHSKLAGLTIELAFPSLASTKIPAICKEVAKTGTTWDSEEVYYHDDKISGVYKVNAFQVTQGKMIAMFMDITEIKKYELALKEKNEELRAAEEELRETNEKLMLLNELLQNQNDELKRTYRLLQENEEKFRAAFKTSPDSVNINRLEDGMFIEINDGFTQLTGYTWEDVNGKTSLDISIWADLDARKQLIEKLKASGSVINMEARFRMKNGDIRIGLISAKILNLQDEKYILSVTRDIEETIKAQVALKESEEKFIQFAENIDDVFWISEQDRLLYINTAIERKFGIPQEEILANPFIISEMIHADDLPVYHRLLRVGNTRTKKPFSGQFRITDPHGKIRWIWARLFPIYNSDNKLYRIAGIASDITTQKQIEFELRTAKEKAQESDHLKSAFLANISHEIRTPMNGIIGFSALLGKEEDDPDVKEQYLKIIKKSGDQLLHIIDDLVDISKIESGQMHIFRHACNINGLLHEIRIFYLQELQRLKKHNIELMLQAELSDAASIIETDENRLRQILTNLLNNAVKFTESGQIRFGCVQEDLGFIKFFVEDTGIGIENELAGIIFEPFRQADYTTSKQYGGTGLGLSISRGLVYLLGGKIWMESKPGIGSVFYFTIPGQTGSADQENFADDHMSRQNYYWGKKKILVVEDDDINFKYIKEVLSTTGIKIIRATTGLMAVEETDRSKPDLILMDIRLPVMTGLDAARKIRSTGSRIPIIAQTAYVMPEDRSACLEAGCNDFLPKPASMDMLLKKISGFI
jgi:PAS domain S-box-containing protein